jgi:hypothetical protein
MMRILISKPGKADEKNRLKIIIGWNSMHEPDTKLEYFYNLQGGPGAYFHHALR